MTNKTNTINDTQMASLIHYHHPHLKIKDIRAILRAQEDIIEYGLDTEQRIKFGKLFIVEPVVLQKRKYYDAINQKEIELGKRLRFHFRPLKGIKNLERDLPEK